MGGMDERRLGAQEDQGGPQDRSRAGGRARQDRVEKQLPAPGRQSPHAKLLMSLGPWPALKESRVLKMVTREEGEATAQAALRFLGAGRVMGGAVGGTCRGCWLRGGSGRGDFGGSRPQAPKVLSTCTRFQPVLPSLQDLMTQNGISYVLNASNSCPKPDFICESRFMRIPINDNYCEKLLPWLDKSIEFIGKGAPSPHSAGSRARGRRADWGGSSPGAVAEGEQCAGRASLPGVGRG